MELNLLKAKNGELTLLAKTGDRQVYLHSAFNPTREAERWVNNIEVSEDAVLFICGGGLGYHLKLLRNKYPETHIILVEPEKQLFDIGKENYSELVKDAKFHYLISPTSAEVINLINMTTTLYALNKVHLLEFEPICRIYGDFLNYFRTIFFEALSKLSVNINTMLHFALVWPVNFFRNFKHIVTNPIVSDLFGYFTNVPAIIVSAGPSLSKNIGHLKDAKGKALIIAVGTALKALLAEGIDPDLVISVDGGAPNYKHFEKISCEVPLVFDVGIYPQIVEEYDGSKWVCCCDRYLLSWFQEALNINIIELKSGPSVANVAMDFAYRLGCNPIILVGQDLAYTEGRSHASGTVYQDVKAEDYSRRLIPVEDINGGTVYTDRVFLAMLSWFEQEIASYPDSIKVIDATEGGARISGTQVMALKKAIEEYCISNHNEVALFKESHRKRRLTGDQGKQVEEKLKELVDGLENLAKIGAKGSKLSNEMNSLYEKLPYLNAKKRRRLSIVLSELEKLDRNFSETRSVTALFVMAFQPLLMRLYNSEFLQERPGETEQEAGKRLAKKSLLLYRGIEEIATYMRPVVEQALKWAQTYGTE